MKHRDGYTLFELLVVLGVLALVSAVAWPNFNAAKRDDVLMREAQSTVLNVLRDARASAVSSNRDVTVIIDPQNRVVIDKDGNTKSLPSVIAMRILFAAKTPTPGSAVFRFYPDGTSTGGDVELAIEDIKSSIAVNWLTGESQVTVAP